MPPEDIQKKIRHKPFRPFRLYLSDGSVYEIRHPELVLLGRRSLIVGLTGDPTETLYERTVDVDLLHIVRMDYLDMPATHDGAS
jgi:hypothetical protein